MKSYQQLFAELKRRHVFRVAGLYGIVSFGVLQAADLMLPRLGMPDWTVTFMVALVVLAFPVALILAWAFEVTPDGVKKTGAVSPEELAAIAAEPASRRWPVGLLALFGVAALVTGAWWVGRRSGAAEEAGAASGAAPAPHMALTSLADDPRPSIAVLPFADMSPQGDQEYFSDGMTEELLNTLAKIQQLRVAARTSTFAFKETSLTAAQLGDTLQVRYFVEGSVRKAGDQLRITAQLIDTSTGSHLWSDTYDRTLDDVFAIQTEIAEAIADQLRVPLGLDGNQALVTPTGDLEAYDLYLAAKGRMRERGSGVAEAVRLFEAAIARDSSWAPAWAGLALSQATLPWYLTKSNRGRPWAEYLAAGERAAKQALALDSANVTAWVALGTVHRERREWPEAEAAFERALARDPDDAEANQQYAEYLAYVGRIGASVDMARRAIDLDRVPVRLNVVAYGETLNGRYAEALAMFDAADRLDPTDAAGFVRRNRLRAYVSMGDWAAARELVRRYSGEEHEGLRAAADAWPPGSPPTPDVAERITSAYPDIAAVVWMTLNRRDRAIDALGTLDADYGPTHYFWQPALEPLLDDPAVQELLRRSNLAGVRPRRTPR